MHYCCHCNKWKYLNALKICADCITAWYSART
jgi:hypothetical protein